MAQDTSLVVKPLFRAKVGILPFLTKYPAAIIKEIDHTSNAFFIHPTFFTSDTNSESDLQVLPPFVYFCFAGHDLHGSPHFVSTYLLTMLSWGIPVWYNQTEFERKEDTLNNQNR